MSAVIVGWGLFMIGGATWAIYAGRQARKEGDVDAGANPDAAEDADGEAGDAEVPPGPGRGGYALAGVLVLFGLIVVGIGVWTLL